MWWGRPWFSPWVRKIPWRRAWQPAPVFLPGDSHGQRSLAGYSPWGHRIGYDGVNEHATHSLETIGRTWLGILREGNKRSYLCLDFQSLLVSHDAAQAECVCGVDGWALALDLSLDLSFPVCRTSGVNGFQGPSRLHHSESLSSLSFQCLVRRVIMQVKQEVGWALLVNGIPAAC